MKEIDVLVIGRSCVDYISVIEGFPEENSKVPLEFRITEGGGQGGTAACCVSKLGGNVNYIGRFGDDEEGRFCLKRLRDFDVNIDHVEIVKGGKTPVAYIFVTAGSGNRTIMYEPTRLPEIEITCKIENLIERTKVLLLDPQTTYISARVKALASSDFRIVYDCERWKKGIYEMMSLADYFIPSAEFLEVKELNSGGVSFKERMLLLKDMIAGELIVTAGCDGAYYVYDGSLYHVSAPEVRVMDTTGAGDNFHGAFSLGVSRGFDIHEAVKFAVAVASLSCCGYGGRGKIPSMEEALEIAGKLESVVVFHCSS